MSASISPGDVEKKLKDNTNGLNNEDSMKGVSSCIKFSEAVAAIYGPYIKNTVVIQHLEKLMSQTEGVEVIIPGLSNPCVNKMLAAAKIHEENWKNGNNFLLILCGFFIKEIQSLKNAGISSTDIHDGYFAALTEALTLMNKLEVNLKKMNVKGRNRPKIGVKIPKNNNMKKKPSCIRSCEINSDKRAKLNGKNELLIQGKKKRNNYNNTKITFNSKDSIDEFSCDGIFVVDDVLCLLRYYLSNLNNRRIEPYTDPVNIILYSSNISCSSTDLKNNCIVHDVENRLAFINLYLNDMKMQFDTTVIVAVGEIDRLFLSKMNQENILVVTVENQFELQRLQKAVGGSLITDFTNYPKKEDIARASSVMVEDLTNGNFIAVFKIKENDLNMKTVFVRDITYVDVKSDEKSVTSTSGAGIIEFLIGKKVTEYADNFTSTQKLAVESFSKAMEAFSAILKPATFSTSEMNPVENCSSRDLLADFDVEDQSLIIKALDSGMMDSFQEKCNVIRMAMNCAFDILDI